MRLLICSTADEASVNIKKRLLESSSWKEEGAFDADPIFWRSNDILVTIQATHLFADDMDKKVEGVTGKKIDMAVFLSRHKAASGIRTLTVHPIGNYGKADYGGRPGELVPSSPGMMTCTLRALQRNARDLDFQVSYEVTHHGPYLETPTMYIEIGSGEADWGDSEAAKAIAFSLLEAETIEAPKAIGVGGGHYAPRFSEVIMTKKVAFGHMIPNHFADQVDDETLMKAMKMAMEKSDDARLVYIHKKSMARSRATHIKGLVGRLGAETIDSSGLEDL